MSGSPLVTLARFRVRFWLAVARTASQQTTAAYDDLVATEARAEARLEARTTR